MVIAHFTIGIFSLRRSCILAMACQSAVTTWGDNFQSPLKLDDIGIDKKTPPKALAKIHAESTEKTIKNFAGKGDLAEPTRKTANDSAEPTEKTIKDAADAISKAAKDLAEKTSSELVRPIEKTEKHCRCPLSGKAKRLIAANMTTLSGRTTLH